MLQPLLNMFDRWAWACFNKRQVAFMNHISPRFFRKPDVKPIDQMNTLIKLTRFFILHLVLSPLVFFIPLYHVLGRKHFTPARRTFIYSINAVFCKNALIPSIKPSANGSSGSQYVSKLPEWSSGASFNT